MEKEENQNNVSTDQNQDISKKTEGNEEISADENNQETLSKLWFT